jgi:hypothetical protein
VRGAILSSHLERKRIMPTKSAHSEENARPEETAQDSLAERLDALEERLAQVEKSAHTTHDLALGQKELDAIAQAIQPHIEQHVHATLKKHLGIAPPPVRGDGS